MLELRSRVKPYKLLQRESGTRFHAGNIGGVDAARGVDVEPEVCLCGNLTGTRFQGADVARIHRARVVDVAHQKTNRGSGRCTRRAVNIGQRNPDLLIVRDARQRHPDFIAARSQYWRRTAGG